MNQHTMSYAVVNDIEALAIITDLRDYLAKNNLQFFKIEEEWKGRDKYIRFSLSIKVNTNNKE